ncbi:MAG TPA: glycine cleavage system protein GcvH [Longimicrobiales bacterium]|nr:glycine cleavage system protein GcvH [Longimicrobiales bacterium]
MSDIPGDLLYTEEHEYLKATDQEGVYVVGVTDYAQGELGDVVFVELPDEGASFNKMDTFGTIEAVKAVSDLFCPVAGEIIEANAHLQDDPSLVNSDPYGAGWMVKLKVTDTGDLEGLMDAASYAAHVGD